MHTPPLYRLKHLNSNSRSNPSWASFSWQRPRTAWSRKFRPVCAKSCRCSNLNFGPPALLYDPTRCNTPLVETQWILDFYQDKQSSLPIRVLNAKEATTTRPVHAKLRDASQLHYSHSIISNIASSLICKHNFSGLTDKCRRYIRLNFSVLNPQKDSNRARC